ncbi:hypothetical protein GOQ27_07125 [Clostridium sp. D2Q-11]|uniref:Uncharacterized protein n=1 Tax=Anaeromonas frigoriresistens TaxID=2683708 RepID=A0A942US43_9FIRM|nr:hypothetical protein [Anaeromonas frigoriresistens]MBS4538229.1 hypothetical protein [Anaeromonas frigoriresistens]
MKVEVENMRVINKSVDMIAIFNKDGTIRPWKFKFDNGDEEIKIKVDTLQFSDKIKHCGRIIHTYRCQSNINNTLRVYELHYIGDKMEWYLYKI